MKSKNERIKADKIITMLSNLFEQKQKISVNEAKEID